MYCQPEKEHDSMHCIFAKDVVMENKWNENMQNYINEARYIWTGG